MHRNDDKIDPMVRRKIANEKLSKRQTQKTLSIVAFIGCFFLAVNIYTAMKPYLGPLPIYFNLVSTTHYTSKISTSRSNQVEMIHPIISNFSNYRTDVYELNGDVRIHGFSSTIFVASSHAHTSNLPYIRPYPRKDNFGAMKRVTNFQIITKVDDNTPRCTSFHANTPAILFSAGGLAGNHFHAMTDVIVPLFTTSHQFNQSIIFLVSSYNDEWTSKYRVIMEKLSKYDMYDIDKENEVLCFSRMIVGLKAHKDLEIVPSPNFSRRNFTNLLQLDILPLHQDHQPRMLIISRNESRKLMNEHEVEDMARSLGFDVVVKKLSSNVLSNAKLANSFDVMVGVHGAGLSNLVFLRENAILIQIVPFGLDYLARVCFEGAVESNKLKYLRYNVALNESSLLGKYPHNSKIYRNPRSVSMNFQLFSKVYLDNQDVNLDLKRFRETLSRALELLGT